MIEPSLYRASLKNDFYDNEKSMISRLRQLGPVWQGSSSALAPAPLEEPCQTFCWRSYFFVKNRGAGVIFKEP
jgi:hypothetical protein